MTHRILIASAALLFGAAAPALAFDPIVVIGGQAPVIHPGGGTQEVLATKAQTDGKFGSTTTTDPAGGGPGANIVHANEAEIWYVLEGDYTFHVNGRTFEGGPGTFVAVDAGQPHEYTTNTPGKLLMIRQPGGFEQFFMDWDKQGLQPGPDLGKLEASYGVTRP
jgi:mannose-6-phosphate isomerase-like protein (cupin superfamily)